MRPTDGNTVTRMWKCDHDAGIRCMYTTPPQSDIGPVRPRGQYHPDFSIRQRARPTCAGVRIESFVECASTKSRRTGVRPWRSDRRHWSDPPEVQRLFGKYLRSGAG